MKRVLWLALVPVVCTSFLACQPGGALSDQDKAAIRKVVDDATKIATSPKADFATYVQLYYTEDATVLTSNMPPVEGRAGIQAFLSSFPPLSEFKADIIDMDGRGDLAYVRGNYTMTMNPPGAPPVTDNGKYVEIWKKQADGSWKVKYDSFSSDVAAPGLIVPTGHMAANASPEVQKLNEMVGKWQISGTAKRDPKATAEPVDLLLNCQWFATGSAVFCVYTGTSAGGPYQETDIYSYDPRAKAYAIHSAMTQGGALAGKLTIEGDKWTHVWEFPQDGTLAKLRLVISSPKPEGGTWATDVSVAGGPWVAMGGGKYLRSK